MRFADHLLLRNTAFKGDFCFETSQDLLCQAEDHGLAVKKYWSAQRHWIIKMLDQIINILICKYLNDRKQMDIKEN